MKIVTLPNEGSRLIKKTINIINRKGTNATQIGNDYLVSFPGKGHLEMAYPNAWPRESKISYFNKDNKETQRIVIQSDIGEEAYQLQQNFHNLTTSIKARPDFTERGPLTDLADFLTKKFNQLFKLNKK